MAAILDRLGLDGRQQRALFGVRAKLTLRQFTREPGKILGLIFGLIIFVPLVMALAAATAAGYIYLPEPWPTQLLGGILVGVWLFWLVYPILFSSLNEGLDPSRLLLYPLRGRDLATAVLLGTLLDYTTYIMLPLFVAVVVGFWSWQIPIVLLGLLLAYGHLIVASQLMITIFGGLFSSRRFRDVIILISSLSGIACYLSQYALQNVGQLDPEQFDPNQLAQLRPLNWLQWLPTGAVARAIDQALLNNWLGTVAWLLYSTVFLLFLTYIWLQLLRRLSTGQGFLIAAGATKEKPKTAVAPRQRRQRALLPSDVREIAIKEAKQIWRTPQRRIGLLWSAIMPVVFFGPFLAQGGFAEGVPAWASLSLPLYAMFTFWITGQNMLGFEGKGFSTLLLTPIPRRRYFWGKCATLALLGMPIYLIMSVGLFIALPTWLTLASFVTGLAVLPTSLAVSCCASVLFPFPVKLEVTTGGGLNSGRNGGGLVTGLANAFVVPLFLGAANLPLLAALGVAYWFDLNWFVFVLPLSLLYGGVIFWLGTSLAGRLMLSREPEIVASLRRPEDGV